MISFDEAVSAAGLEITFASSLENIDPVTAEAQSFCQANFENLDEFALKLVLYEALTNAVRHGNRCDPSKQVLAFLSARCGELHITIRDEGDGFVREDRYFELPDRFTTGGRGLFLLNSYCDKVSHNERGNEVYSDYAAGLLTGMTEPSRARMAVPSLLAASLLPLSACIALAILTPGWTRSHVPIHSLLDATSGLIALALAGILLTVRRHEAPLGCRLWLSAALIGMGVIDLLHAAVEPGATSVGMHSLVTFMGGTLLALVWLPAQLRGFCRARGLLLCSGMAALAFGAVSLSSPQTLPAVLERGSFTSLAQGCNLIGGLGFLSAAVWFMRRYRSGQQRDGYLFAYFCVLQGAAGALFVLSEPWNAAWWCWHLLRLAAYLLALIYCGVAFIKTLEWLHREILERKRAVLALRESEETARALLNATSDEVVMLDHQGTILDANAACGAALGKRRDELLGLCIWKLLPADDLKQRKQDVESAFLSGEPLRRRAHYEGLGKWTDTSIYPVLDTRTAVSRVVIFVQDITERKRYEQALKEYSDQLEEMVEQRTRELREAQDTLIRKERLATLGQLAGSVSHELRNPLGAIKNAVYFLRLALERPEPDIEETLQILERELTVSDRIISSLLDYARPRSPIRHRVEINRTLFKALERSNLPRNVELIIRPGERLPSILADPDQLGQVFGNIIQNAVQVIPQGGTLEVSSTAQDSDWVAITFTDTGAGIREEHLGKIFEPLFTTKAKGIGLGMALSRKIIEGHRGTIEVRSELGKGSTFTVRLPTLDPATLPSPSGEDSGLKGGHP